MLIMACTFTRASLVPFVPMSAVEAAEADGCDDPQRGQETHANEEGEGDKP